MTLPDFLTGLELELRLRAVPCDRGELDVGRRRAEPGRDDADVIRWAEAFLAWRQAAGA